MSKIKSQISFYDLTGGINNVDTMERFNSSPRKTETPDMLNVEYYKLGGIKSMEGNTQIGSTQSAPVVGGWEYTKGNNRYMIIALKTGELKVYTAIENDDEIEYDFVEVYKFPSNADRVSFCNMNNGVVATNGIDDPVFYEYGRHQAIDGSVSVTNGTVTGTSTQFTVQLKVGTKIEIDDGAYKVASIASDTSMTIVNWSNGETPTLSLSDKTVYVTEISPCCATLVNSQPEPGAEGVNTPIRGTAIQYYNGRLWIGTDNGLFYSAVGLYDNWDIYSDAGVIYSIYNDSSEIQALGLYSDYMLVHKKFNTYLLTCNGESSTIEVKPYSNITCNSQQSFCLSNTKYYVYSKEHRDIYPLSQRTVFSDRYLGESITDKVRNIFQQLNDNDTNSIFCVTYPRKRWMIFYLPLVSGAGSNYALIFDFQTKSFLARQLPREQYVTIAFNYNSNVYVGTYDGKVLREFSGQTFNGQNMNCYYKSPWFDWADNYTHSFSEFIISLAPEINNNFKIRTFKDGDSKFEARTINSEELITTGLIWDGDEHLDTDDTMWDKDVWTAGTFNSIRMLLPNNVFEQFQLEIYTDGEDNQGFAIDGYAFRRLRTDEAPW